MKIHAGFFSLLFGFIALTAAPQKGFGEEVFHTVQRGETFYSIARFFGVTVSDLMELNGATDPATLKTGQRLRIPGVPASRQGTVSGAASSAAQSAYTSYRVVRGDTLYGIARRFSVTVAEIQAANSLAADYILREGDSLRIPRAAPSVARDVPSVPVPEGRSGQPEVNPRETVSGNLDPSVRWPVNARELSYMTGKLSGVVITGTRAESVESLTVGTVISAGPYRGFGRVVIVQVEGGYLYVYGGCESLSVKEGDRIGPGTEVGKLGIDAVSNKPQLFFMVYRSNTPVDPAKAPRL